MVTVPATACRGSNGSANGRPGSPDSPARQGTGSIDSSANGRTCGFGEPHPRRWLVFMVVGIALLMMAVDQTIVATALGSIQRDLGAAVNWSSWTITVYSLGQIIAMPVAGRLSEQFGRKRIFLAAIALFVVSSLCCSLAGNIYMLILFRALQALGGGAVLPSAAGIVSDYFGPSRDRALGLFTSIFPIGAVLGPSLGGLIVGYLSWRMIFFVNLPIGLLLLVLGALLIRETRGRAAATRIDVRGIALLSVLILAAMYGIALLGNEGTRLTEPRFLVAELVAVLAGCLLIRHLRRDPAAIVPLALLRGRAFAVMHVLNLLLGAAAVGFAALVPLYAELRFGFTPLEAGSLLTARALGMIAMSAVAVMLLRRVSNRLLMVVGYVVLASGLTMLALSPIAVSGYAWLTVAAGLTGLGMGIAAPAANNATMHQAPEHVAAITGLRGMFRQSGAIFAVSMTTAVVAGSAQPAIAQANAFAVFAFLLVLAMPLTLFLPNHRGSW